MKNSLRFLSLFLFSANCLFAQMNFTNGLKCYYPMNGDFYNATNDCQKHPDFTSATFTADVDAMANDAGFFNGSTRLRMLNKLVNTDMASFSIDFWFQSSSTSNEPLYYEAATNGQGVWIRMEPGSNRIHASLGNSSSNNNVYTTGAFNDGNWHHLALTAQTGNTAKIYIDGVLNVTNVQTYNTGTTSSVTKIGTDDALTIYLNGGLDNMRIWNRPLTSTEVNDLYNAPRINIAVPASTTLCAGSGTTVSFTVSGGSGQFQNGNIFYAQLSDPQGTFKYPLNIGSTTGTGSGSITLNIPDSVATSSTYRIRIVGSQYPVASQNTQTITINSADAFPAYDVVSNLGFHYPFDGNATDVSGNSIHGTITGGVTNVPGHDGQPNSALRLNGTNGYIGIGTTWPVDRLNGTTIPFSISTWIYQYSTPAVWGYVFSCWDPNAGNGVWLGTTSGGKIRFRINGSNFVEGNIPNNQWAHVVAVYNGTNIKLYVNNVQTGGTVTTSGNISIVTSAQIGRDQVVNNYFLNANLDEFRFYDHVLTVQEVNILYHESQASSNSPLCNGGTLLLNGPAYPGLQYDWTGPSNYSDNVEDPFLVNFNPFTNVGLYNLTMTLNGCTGTPQPAPVQSSVPVVPAVVHANFCSGNSVTLTASGATAGQQYVWYSDANGNTSIAGNVSSYTYSPATTDTVYVSLYDGVSCYSALTPVIATMYTQPNVVASSSPVNGIVCAGTSVTLSGSGAVSYVWTGSVTNNVAFTPSASMNYTVTGTDVNGCTNTASISITVNPLPTVTVTITPSNGTVCNGNPVILDGNGSATTYSWSGGVLDNVAFTPSSSATYTLTATHANGCSTTATANVTVNSLPNVTAASVPVNGMVCIGGTATLHGNGASTYAWSGGVTNNIPFTPSSSSNYTVTGTNANGCTNTATIAITVNPLPVVSASSIPSSGIVCSGSAATLNGNGASTYSWSGGITNGIPFTATSSSTYTVTGTNANGCVNTATIALTVNPLPTVTVTITPSNGTVCNGDSIVLNGNGSATTYNWSGGVLNNAAFTPSSSATYTLTATNTNGCITTATANVIVHVLPNVTATSVPVNGIVCTGGAATLNGNGASTYTWTGGVTNNIPFTPSSSSGYTVTGTDANGCTNTAPISLTVNPLPIVTFTLPTTAYCVNWSAITLSASPVGGTFSGTGVSGNSFDPAVAGAGSFSLNYLFTDGNGCTNNDTALANVDLCLDANEVGQENTFNIYPNPNNGIFTLQINTNEIASVNIYDAAGQLVSEEKVQPGALHQLFLENAGIYFITVIAVNGERTTQRVIVQH